MSASESENPNTLGEHLRTTLAHRADCHVGLGALWFVLLWEIQQPYQQSSEGWKNGAFDDVHLWRS